MALYDGRNVTSCMRYSSRRGASDRIKKPSAKAREAKFARLLRGNAELACTRLPREKKPVTRICVARLTEGQRCLHPAVRALDAIAMIPKLRNYGYEKFPRADQHAMPMPTGGGAGAVVSQ